MNMKTTGKRGFTLLEVIVVLLIVGILAAVMAPFFGRNLTDSGTPIFNLQDALGTVEVMENITSEYRSKTSNNPVTAMNDLKIQINNGSFNSATLTAIATDIPNLDPANLNEPPVIMQVVVTNSNTGETMLALFTGI